MTKIVQGIKSLFGGDSGAKQAAADAKAQATAATQSAAINQLRQQQAADDQAATSNGALAAVGRAPRGQRLLVSSADGGLATTLGTSA